MASQLAHSTGRYCGLALVLLTLSLLVFPAARAQQGTASVNGVVADQSGAVIPKAQVKLTNVSTGVARTTSTNSDGLYTFLSVVPGVYSMQVSASGFTSVTQPPVTLQVDQIGTFDFHLKVGTTQSSITVNATAPALQSSTSQLGTVITTQQVSNLPLNGRNFTQLLTLTTGVANINTDQNNNGGGGWNGTTIGKTVIPSINGAGNRSNLFELDGANDSNTFSGSYNYQPIVDAIQEFKIQDHNDLAQFGGAAGGTITVVTKSGANHYHGDFWEFLRNEQMDSRGFFEAHRAPLRQNQFGATVGGPLSIPKIYNGKNRTFFFLAYEGYRYASTEQTGALGPTDAMRNGDFSALGTPIYDPMTTKFDPTTGSYSRQTFTQEYNEPNPSYCNGAVNCIPTSRISPISALMQTIIPHSGNLVNGSNVFFPTRSVMNQSSGTLRVDQNFGNTNQLSFRYSQFDLSGFRPQGVIGLGTIHDPGRNYIGHWMHTFSPTAFTDIYLGRNVGSAHIGTTHPGEDAAFLSQLQSLGMSTFWMTLNNQLFAPQYNVDGYVGLNGSQVQATGLADTWQVGGTFTKIIGINTIKAGADFETNRLVSPIAYAGDSFGAAQTAGLGADQGIGGNSWASLLVGVPREGSYRNIHEVAHGGWINGFFVQDQIRATNRITLNLGFRSDMVLTPIYGSGNAGNFYTGEANPLTGQYILNALPPDCSATQGAPCIPVGPYTSSSTPAPGGLPPHTVVNKTLRMINNSVFNPAGRVGLAFRYNDKTVLRGGYGRQYDTWATITQLSQNFGGNWPAVVTIDNNTLNTTVPTAFANDPLGFGKAGSIIYPSNDFSKVSQWMVDPNFQTPSYDMWNAGVERQLPSNAVIDVEYVGSVGRHVDWGPPMNTPQPGPGEVQARRPFPYMQQQWFDQSVGNTRYNALEVTFNKRPTHGVGLLTAYTFAKNTGDGCNLGASCNSSNPYNRKGDYGISDLNQTHAFSVALTAQSPTNFTQNRLASHLMGGWALDGIVTLTSGLPYTVVAGGDPENIGSGLQERMDLVGHPDSGPGIHTREQWFNRSAFATPPPYTYGNEHVNPLTSDWNRDIDLSLARSFHIKAGEGRFFQFRVDSFNLFNNVVFARPDRTSTDATYGQVTSQANSPRQLQLSLKFIY